MRIGFDPAKDVANQAKHGLSLALAADLEWGSAMVWMDGRKEYGETRQSALALIGQRLYFVAFVDRGDALRPISPRKANIREVTHYAKNE
jgi:uncharacterized DUF497 family protein